MVRLYQVDSFTDIPFTGNPAGVLIIQPQLRATWASGWEQKLASEMNLSETAYVEEIVFPTGGRHFHLRWFTPSTEVSLCGHATLAAAHILWEQKIVPIEEEIRFTTLSGVLSAKKKGSWIELDFPVQIPQRIDHPPALLFSGLPNANIKFVGSTGMYWLVEVESEEMVRSLIPNTSALIGLDHVGGFIVTSAPSETKSFTYGSLSPDRVDFVSRFFGPSLGVAEDPVTGSAHCSLAPYWGVKLNKKKMIGYQASQRGGVVEVEWNEDKGRVILRGQAMTVMSCDLLVPLPTTPTTNPNFI